LWAKVAQNPDHWEKIEKNGEKDRFVEKSSGLLRTEKKYSLVYFHFKHRTRYHAMSEV